jgi:hypothetical protein
MRVFPARPENLKQDADEVKSSKRYREVRKGLKRLAG